jgi:hypothetical protein
MTISYPPGGIIVASIYQPLQLTAMSGYPLAGKRPVRPGRFGGETFALLAPG